MMKRLLQVMLACAIAFNVQAVRAEEDGGDKVEELRQKIIDMMLVKPNTVVNSESGDKKTFEDNINSVRENQNKIKINAATRAIALGRRAVALATASGDDLEARRKAIEKNDDVLNMLKDIARLQAQHLQKTNEITALRAKLTELNAIEKIISGNVLTTDEEALKKSGSKS